MKMEQSHRESILKNIDFLIQNTSDEAFEYLLEKFSSNHGLSPYMLQKIKKGTSLEKKRKFYEMVPKRGPDAFRKLCECLISVGLKNLAEKLRGSRLFLDGCFPSKLNGSSHKVENNYEEHYVIQSNPRGHVLIINIMNYLYNPYLLRDGSERDVASLEKLWNKLGYRVTTHQDLTCEEFKKVIDDFINMTKSDRLDSVFVFVMTHGIRNGSNHREVELQMSDSGLINSDWILDRFTSVHSKHLADIPKVIFIQACRGDDRDLGTWIENDSGHENFVYNEDIDSGKKPSPKPRYSNLLVVFSTLPGFVAKRNPVTGAPFIQELCRIIKTKSEKSHLLDMIHEVNRNLQDEGRNYDNFGFSKQLYLV
ncbi:caspase-14 [Halyomorpha halys]|uniref:caspase-14 n=1 Tax=Halyomorpha halys TaxID=286706 RepID=UPI0006D4DCD1|nr:caspase-2-like [Halyomorpha halys]XP_014293905.1 caspase-2-like [Halyomorpha halys]